MRGEGLTLSRDGPGRSLQEMGHVWIRSWKLPWECLRTLNCPNQISFGLLGCCALTLYICNTSCWALISALCDTRPAVDGLHP